MAQDPAEATDLTNHRSFVEAQAAIVMAKQFPRDKETAIADILDECRNVELAEKSMYNYSRDGSEITGPNIKLAETMARCWGNLSSGFYEVKRRSRESDVYCFVCELQKNYRRDRTITVQHVREVEQKIYPLDSPHDIREEIANQAQRQIRSLLLSIIPKHVQNLAIEQCRNTLIEHAQKSGISIDLRISEQLTYFNSRFSVTKEMIADRIGHSVESITEDELIDLKTIAESLKEDARPEDYFNLTLGSERKEGESKSESLAKKAAAKRKAKGVGNSQTKNTTSPE